MTENTIVTSTAEMDWTPLGPTGLYTKMLRQRPDGGRTALQRLDMSGGYTPPARAHFHNVYEEIICVKGVMSFDSQMWLHSGDYVYHPPRMVHGFMSGLKGEAWFLSRVGATLDFNYINEPLKKEAYAVGLSPETRPYAVTPRAKKSSAVEAGGRGAIEAVLSVDTASGEGSRLVELAPGAAHTLAPDDGMELELFVVQGSVQGTTGGFEASASWMEGTFVYAPDWPKEGVQIAAGEDGAIVYVTVLRTSTRDA